MILWHRKCMQENSLEPETFGTSIYVRRMCTHMMCTHMAINFRICGVRFVRHCGAMPIIIIAHSTESAERTSDTRRGNDADRALADDFITPILMHACHAIR